jgi:hypothetical protein
MFQRETPKTLQLTPIKKIKTLLVVKNQPD